MIEKMNLHYSFTNPASVHDEEALTALELAGRQGAKINEVIEDQNNLRTETENHLSEQDGEISNIREVVVPNDVKNEVQHQIQNGTFDKQIDKSLGELEERVNNVLNQATGGNTDGNTELIDARVGANSRTYLNAGESVREQIKVINRVSGFSGIRVIDVNELPIYKTGCYMNSDGTETTLADGEIRLFEPDADDFWVAFTGVKGYVCGAMFNNDGVYSRSIGENMMGNQVAIICAGLKFYINRDKVGNKGVHYLTVFKANYLEKAGNILTPEMLHKKDSYITSNTTIDTLKGCDIYKIPIDHKYDYYYRSESGKLASLVLGNLFDENDNHIGAVTFYNGKFEQLDKYHGRYTNLPENAAYLLTNVSDQSQTLPDSFIYKVLKHECAEPEKVIDHILNKPFTFNGKTALFFGDSIVKGYTSGDTTTTNNFVKLFSDKTGLVSTNYGVAGSVFTDGFERATILSKMNTVPLNTDFVFVAGGVNDIHVGVPVEAFKTAVNEICTYIKNNYSGEVFFIAPINYSLAVDGDSNEYRRVIEEACIKHEFNFINGGLFAFPDKVGEISAQLYGDNLHPTEKGYRLYTRELCKILL